eukprot:COSAG02_NODE_13104_length_1445_cov_5.784547_2_plen_120_part_00
MDFPLHWNQDGYRMTYADPRHQGGWYYRLAVLLFFSPTGAKATSVPRYSTSTSIPAGKLTVCAHSVCAHSCHIYRGKAAPTTAAEAARCCSLPYCRRAALLALTQPHVPQILQQKRTST